MLQINMKSKTEELIETLKQIILVLECDGESHWIKWVTKVKKKLLASDYSGIEYLLGAYGGMGSFNDLVICQSTKDEKFEWKPNYRESNEKLTLLRSKAYELAKYIERNHEI